MKLTRAVPHIRLYATNDSKMRALDTLAGEYLALCQQYTTLFVTEAQPDKYAAPCFDSPLSRALAASRHSTGGRHCSIVALQSGKCSGGLPGGVCGVGRKAQGR